MELHYEIRKVPLVIIRIIYFLVAKISTKGSFLKKLACDKFFHFNYLTWLREIFDTIPIKSL